MKKKLWKDEEKRDSVYRDLAPINSIKPEELTKDRQKNSGGYN